MVERKLNYRAYEQIKEILMEKIFRNSLIY